MEVVYQGRTICTDFFRAFVYGAHDAQKLANSYDEYMDLIQSGDWYSTKEQAQDALSETKKTKRRTKEG